MTRYSSAFGPAGLLAIAAKIPSPQIGVSTRSDMKTRAVSGVQSQRGSVAEQIRMMTAAPFTIFLFFV